MGQRGPQGTLLAYLSMRAAGGMLFLVDKTRWPKFRQDGYLWRKEGLFDSASEWRTKLKSGLSPPARVLVGDILCCQCQSVTQNVNGLVVRACCPRAAAVLPGPAIFKAAA